MCAILTRAGVTSQPGLAENKGFILFFECSSVSFCGVQRIATEDAAELHNLCNFYPKNC